MEESKILPELDNFDWEEAFKYADGVSRGDVESIIAHTCGENDGDAWIGLFKLKDGRYLALRAWCDYTGWGCQEGGDSTLHADLDNGWLIGLTNEERTRLAPCVPEIVERLGV